MLIRARTGMGLVPEAGAACRMSMSDTPCHAGPDQVLVLRDGRRVAYREFGAPAGWPVLSLHGTPGSRLMFAIAASAAAELGLRLIAPDRWGYGGTDAHPRPSFAAWGRDAAELADGLGLSRLSLLAISGGSPYAAATAAELGARVTAMALAVPVGPMVGEGPRPRLSMFHWLAFAGLGRRPWLTRTLFGLYRGLLRRSPRRAVSLVALGQCLSDRRLLRVPAIQQSLSRSFGDGLEPGAEGPAIDLTLFSSPWDVPFQRISATTKIWLGREDRIVPLSAIRRLAKIIPGAELAERDGRGHFWIAQEYGQVLEWLAAADQRREIRP